MAAPTPSSLLAFLQQKEFLTGDQLDELAERSQAGDAAALLRDLVRRQWLTAYQANEIAQGSANDLILGAYRILDPIGEGGMGKVYKARHVRMHRDVALKVIPPDCLENASAVSRFYREVRAVSQLSHPNIVTAYEVGQEGKTHYFAMEFVDGIDLARLVKQSGPLPIAKACDYIRQAALGLQHAHEKGLVHRDIKPGNLIIGRSSAGGEPTIKVLDFGLARFEQAGGRATRLTKLGHVLGTVDYISPEQAGNARVGEIRSDIYSLGCALFYLLTGQPPFSGSDAMERMMARIVRPPASVRESRPDVPVELEAIIAKMMARELRERFATPAEVVAALKPYAILSTAMTARPGILTATTATTTATTPSTNNPWTLLDDAITTSPLPSRFRSRKKIGLLAAVVVIVLSVVGIGLFNRSSGTKVKLPNDDPDMGVPVVVTQNGEKGTTGQPMKAEPAKAAPTVKIPSTFTNSLGMEFVLVPKGRSWLGGGGGKPGSKEVDIVNDFYLGKYEVVQEEWQKLMGSNPSKFKSIPGVGDEERMRFPIESVSWDDAQDFIRQLNRVAKEAGWLYRLPTEAEWEYGCRNGTLADSAFDYYFQNPTSQLTPDLANYYANGLKRPCKIGSYNPNRLGIYDFHGNVWEWCDDGFAEGAADRVSRGGGWTAGPEGCRTNTRYLNPRSHRSHDIGFRLARVPALNEKLELPVPIAQWKFDEDAKDTKGNLHGVLHGGAKVENGRLHLDGNGAMKSAHLHVDVRERTLEIWLNIADISQKNRNLFQIGGTGPWDGIVYAQRREKKWFPGSDHDHRSQDLDGPDENAKPTELVHLALVYSASGSITLFRNGKIYGSQYIPKGTNSALQVFKKRESFVTLGDRFVGQIEEASLYDRALGEVEILHLAKTHSGLEREPKEKVSPQSSKATRISLRCRRNEKIAPTRFKSLTYYVAHGNFVGLLDKNLHDNSIFFLEAGLANPVYASLRASNLNLPDFYFCHGNSRFQLAKLQHTDTFRKNATLKIVPGLANPSHISLEAINWPGYFLHVRDDLQLYLDKRSTSKAFLANTTFELIRHGSD